MRCGHGLAKALVLILVSFALAGCGAQVSGDVPVSRMSEAQRDSAIARSEIPGAAAVGRSYQAADRQAARNAALDSLR